MLVIGGSASMPGAVLLAGLAVLRVGAGKLQLAINRSVAPTLAVAVPQALVVPLDENADGTIDGGRGCARRPAGHRSTAGPGLRGRRVVEGCDGLAARGATVDQAAV